MNMTKNTKKKEVYYTWMGVEYNKACCETCRFSGSIGMTGYDDLSRFTCHRYAPRDVDDRGDARFPLVRGGAWCGDFEAREKPKLTKPRD